MIAIKGTKQEPKYEKDHGTEKRREKHARGERHADVNAVPNKSCQSNKGNGNNPRKIDAGKVSNLLLIGKQREKPRATSGIDEREHDGKSQPNILYRGTRFARYEDYLKLFGLKPDEYIPYYTQHPEFHYIYFWAPEYKHHVWHNEGNPGSLMPTITTYYAPDNLPKDSISHAQIAIFNKRRYISAISECPVLITFMKNLFDSTYVFLGVYRLSAKSDSTRQIWKRTQNDVDIDHLKDLERYPN